MKNYILLLVILLSGTAFAQWTSIKETNINVGSAISVDIFTNSYGNHIIVQESSSLKYYKMNVSGTAGSPITLESSTVISPSISGDDNRIYVVYRKNSDSYITSKYSTDGGINWSYISSNPSNSNASSIESVMSNGRLHVTYQVSSSILYRYWTGTAWSSEHTVSTSENGTSPRITARYSGSNNDYVYFLYKKENEETGRWRRYEVTGNSWGSLYSGFSLSNVITSYPTGIRVTGERVIMYYDYFKTVLGNNYWHFAWVERSFTNGSLGGNYIFGNQSGKMFTATTNDNISHTVFKIFNVSGPERVDLWEIDRSKSESGGPNDVVYGFGEEEYPEINHLNLSSAGNDVQVIWQDIFGNNNGDNLRYIYDDQNPVTPQNLAVTSHNGHPKLIWTKNPDADIDFYRIYKKITGQQDFEPYATSGTEEYVDYEEDLCTVPPPAQCENEFLTKYKIKAIDLTDNESDFSDEVEARIIGGPPQKSVAHNSLTEIYSYELRQNYPNPFNPVTTINYQIKDRGFVILKVYDMLGKEVANLVNEAQDVGQYSVDFNAGNLPTGVYIYSLRVNDFVQNNKMTLLK